jgi:hypothetical protein
MVPATPSSSRRGAFKRLSDLQRHATFGNTEDHPGIPIPPLYYEKRDEKEKTPVAKRASYSFTAIPAEEGKESSFVYKTPEKQKIDRWSGMSSSPFSSSTNTFVPIDRPPLFRSTATPPISPLVGKRLSMSATVSPAPSVVSLALTEDITEASSFMTPSPTTSYLQAASISPYFNNSSSHHHHHHRLSGASSVGSGAPLSPRKSPNKYYQQRRSGTVSPLPFSPSRHSTTIPYSPGGSSIGSHSTSTTLDDASRKQRVKTELCMHYSAGRTCPFGSHCTYAHGEAELQMTKLMDLQSGGLIEDAQTYRTKPCLTWVATGSW